MPPGIADPTAVERRRLAHEWAARTACGQHLEAQPLDAVARERLDRVHVQGGRAGAGIELGANPSDAEPRQRHALAPAENGNGTARVRHLEGVQAGEGNRTLVSSLGSYSSAIELHPRREGNGSDARADRATAASRLGGRPPAAIDTAPSGVILHSGCMALTSLVGPGRAVQIGRAHV